MTTRVLIVITQGEEGGAQQFVRHLVTNADRERFRFSVAWGMHTGSFLARTLPDYAERVPLKHLTRNTLSPFQDLAAVGELAATIRLIQPDVLLLISSKAGFVGSLAARRMKKQFPGLRVIYRIGGWTFNDPWPAWKRSLYTFLERRSASWKDVIVVNNLHDLEQARSLGIKPREQLVCIHNGIDPYLPLTSRDEARATLERHINAPRRLPYGFLVGTIANFYPAKGIETLIKAAARVGSEVRFIVIGDGRLRPELERLIAQERVKDRFFLVGHIPEASRLLPAFDAFVLPSLKEGFPWALLEAMAARVPAIATRVGAVPEMIEHGVSGLLCQPGDSIGIAKAIARLRDDERLRRELAITAHQQVLNSFSLRTMVSEFERLLS